MSLSTRIARAAALISVLLVTPALAEGKKVTLSQAFQSMLYLPLYVAIDEGFFTQQGLDLTKETAGARRRSRFPPSFPVVRSSRSMDPNGQRSRLPRVHRSTSSPMS